MANSTTAAVPLARDAAAKQTFPSSVYPAVQIPCTASMHQAAEFMGRLRTSLHNGSRRAEQDLGTNRNLQVDADGLLAELAVLSALLEAGMQPVGFSLLAHPTPRGADFWLNGYSYNIKATRGDYIAINEAQRVHPQKKSNFYLPVVLNTNTAYILAPVPASTIATWQLRTGHSAYRSAPVTFLRPLRDLHELLEVPRSCPGCGQSWFDCPGLCLSEEVPEVSL